MIVLTAIGAFFKKIWDWIRQTAWIQPLLIVGVIFGVIFSIPSIVNAIKDAQKESQSVDNYYYQYQISLEGGDNSDAHKDTVALYKALNKIENSSFTAADKKAIEDAFGASKFFFMYVASNCDKCADAKGGFTVLQDKWNTSDFKPSDNAPELVIHTVFTDQVTAETNSQDTAFQQYLASGDYDHLWEIAGEAARTSDYYINGHLDDESIEALETADRINFLTPTILLYDFSDASNPKGISEVMFGVEADSDYDRAELLLDCWNHTGEFEFK